MIITIGQNFQQKSSVFKNLSINTKIIDINLFIIVFELTSFDLIFQYFFFTF